MSLVQAYITQNFILAGGDTRATLNDGVIIDNFKKIYKQMTPLLLVLLEVLLVMIFCFVII